MKEGLADVLCFSVWEGAPPTSARNRSGNKNVFMINHPDSWRPAEVPSPKFVLILIRVCKVVARPLFAVTSQRLCLSALQRLITASAGAFVAAFRPVIDGWQQAKLEMLRALIVLVNTRTAFIPEVRAS